MTLSSEHISKEQISSAFGRAYSSAGQAALALHSMAVLQVFQEKLLRSIDESSPNPAAFKELCSATDLALCDTKMTAQAIGRSMASLVVLERHLWLNLTEIKEVDKVPFLDSPVFLPKLSSSVAASSRPKMAPTQQPAKTAPKPRPQLLSQLPSPSPAVAHARPDATHFRSARDPGPR